MLKNLIDSLRRIWAWSGSTLVGPMEPHVDRFVEGCPCEDCRIDRLCRSVP